MNNEKKSHNIAWALVSLALAVLTVRTVISQSRSVSPGMLLRLVASSDKFMFICGIVFSALFVLFEGVALCSILKYAGHKKSGLSGLIYSTSDIYFSAITPSATGGQPASMFFMMKEGIPAGVCTATLVLNLMMYTAAIIFLGFIAIIISPGALFDFGLYSKILILIGFVGLTALVLLFLAILKRGRAVFDLLIRLIEFIMKKGITRRGKGLIKRLEKAREDYEKCAGLIAGRKIVPIKAFIWNVLQRTSQMLVPALIFRALGGSAADAPGVFSKQCLITIGYNFLPIPGGMGISDYLMVDGFSEVMGQDMAFQVELLSRGITFYLCVLLSGLITLVGYCYIGRRKTDAS